MSENETTSTASLDQQIMEAVNAGDWTKSFELKSQRQDMMYGFGNSEGATQVEAEAPPLVQESEEERGASLEAQIQQAVADGDWNKSFILKSQLLDRQRATRQKRANGGRL